MTVLVIDDICSLKCPYCFYSTKLAEVREKMLDSGKIEQDDMYVNMDLVKKTIQKMDDFNKIKPVKIGANTIAISGWEPSLHPQFIDICKNFIKKGYNIHLLSNFSFPTDSKVAKFLKKNVDKFEFLVNLNEKKFTPEKFYNNCIENLKNLDTEKMKISLNIFHKDFDFDGMVDVLKNTNKTYIIRFGFPNPEVNHGVNFAVMKHLGKDGLKLYTSDILKQDIEYIDKHDKWIPYWLEEKTLNNYYSELWKELDIMVDLIKSNNWQDRVKFYIDCGFPYDLIDDKTLWFILQRKHYKNPCSIPNGDTHVDGSTSTCYALGEWGNGESQPNINEHSFNNISKYYILSTVFLVDGLLRTSMTRHICSAYALRLFYQLFTKEEDGNFLIWKNILKSNIKNPIIVSDEYFQLWKKWKKTGLYRIYQLVEFLLASQKLEEANKLIKHLQTKLPVFQPDKEQFMFRFHYYKLLWEFLEELFASESQQQDDIREKYSKKLEDVQKMFNMQYDCPSDLLKKLDAMTEQIVKYQQTIK